MKSLPMNTLLDRDPPPAINAVELGLMKLVYLRWSVLRELQAEQDWSDTEIVNTAEKMRRDGLIELLLDDDDCVAIRLTPLGHVTVWGKAHGAVGV